jgi:anaerobic dimethyl sulfoxide reductase subunit B (iron-sulfur subunit)
MAQYGFHVNIKNCIGCKACETACKQEFDLPVGTRRRRVVGQEGEVNGLPVARWVSMACNHCNNPACVSACPVGRIAKDATTGLVLIKPNKTEDPVNGVDCTGCKRCIAGCPYGAMVWDPVAEVSDKCSGCNHRLNNMSLAPEHRKPACVLTCSSFALNFDDISQIDTGGTGTGIYGTASKTTAPTGGMSDIADPTVTNPNIRFKP